ncbi:MAG: Carboxypeptidase Aqualysin 1 [Thermoleophilia bacterium]|nr:Carboxypeptidase Aqualysin 1 [Thermoleophilia bacterium]
MTTITASNFARTTPAPAAATPAFTVDPYDPDVIARRTADAKRAETTADPLPNDLIGKPAPSYFRSYDQLKTALYEMEAKYPGLVEVRDIGDTAEKIAGTADRDILALVLTNKAMTGDKPSTLNVGGIHAREIANPELLMTFANQLLAGHGTNADATMLLDTREVVLVPMLNPDGHAVVEKGFLGERGGNTMQRKNTDAGEPALGTDLNRNFEYKWGGPGASASPRSETYRGPSAASAPETKAIQQFAIANKPDFFIDWHSYSKLNMYPWGDSREKTPHHAAFQALAQKFTSFNGYSPIQAIDLYATTGTTDDTIYAKNGKASMAIETGSSFHQSDQEFAKTLQENLPILSYTAKIADSPFERVFGPDVSSVTVDPTTRQLTATLSDLNNGKQAIAGAEVVLDPNAAPGTGMALTAADGTFDKFDEAVTGAASALPGLDPNAGDGTLVYVRGRDVAGNWGPLTAQWLTGPAKAAANSVSDAATSAAGVS